MCIGFKCSVIFTHDEIIKKNPKNDMNEKNPHLMTKKNTLNVMLHI